MKASRQTVGGALGALAVASLVACNALIALETVPPAPDAGADAAMDALSDAVTVVPDAMADGTLDAPKDVTAVVDAAKVDSGADAGADATVDALADVDAATCVAPSTVCSAACVNLIIDPLNCGMCGNSCTSGACALKKCVVPLVSGQTGAFGITVGDGQVYWTTTQNFVGTGGTKGVWSAPLTAPSSATNLTTPTDNPFYIALDPSSTLPRLAWTSKGTGPNTGQLNWINPVSPVAPTAVATTLPKPGRIVWVQGQAGFYWTNNDGSIGEWLPGITNTVNATWATGSGAGLGITGVGRDVYWTATGGAVYAALFIDGGPTSIAVGASLPPEPVGVGVIGSTLYAAVAGNLSSALYSQPLPFATSSLTMVAPLDHPPVAMISDGSKLFFVTQVGTGSAVRSFISSYDPSSGALTPLASESSAVNDLAVDSTTGLYWVSAAGNVSKLFPR